jgi:hypothetical protein
MVRDAAVERLIAEPSWLPHRVNRSDRSLTFLRTDDRLLRSLSFIDGRDALSQEPMIDVPLAAVLEAMPAGNLPLRMIYHVSFCGSTLLSRLLDRPGRILTLKEPQCLIDLSDWRAQLDRRKASDPEWDLALKAILGLLNRPWRDREKIVIKPSNWANNLIAHVGRYPGGMHSAFVTIERRRFLIALLRGGHERLAFNARAIDHLTAGNEMGRHLVRSALSHDSDPLAAAVRLGALSHHHQHSLFEHSSGAGGRPDLIDLDDIEAAPQKAVSRAATSLSLEPLSSGGDVDVDAKNPGRVFSRERRRQVDADVERLHGAIVDSALDWLDEQLHRDRLDLRSAS